MVSLNHLGWLTGAKSLDYWSPSSRLPHLLMEEDMLPQCSVTVCWNNKFSAPSASCFSKQNTLSPKPPFFCLPLIFSETWYYLALNKTFFFFLREAQHLVNVFCCWNIFLYPFSIFIRKTFDVNYVLQKCVQDPMWENHWFFSHYELYNHHQINTLNTATTPSRVLCSLHFQ